jgi:hypothetical protein
MGNTAARAFCVKISRDEPISELKYAIKAKKQNGFASVDADKLKLWKVQIPDERSELLRNLTLNDGDELLATKKISEYLPDLPAEECIHVIVKSPKSPRKCGTI